MRLTPALLAKSAVFLILLQLSAVSRAGDYMAGVASVDITPAAGSRLPTQSADVRRVEAISDPLAAKALVLTDGASRIAIVSVDLLILRNSDFGFLEEALRKDRGMDHVLVSVTHSHSGFFDDARLDAVRTSILQAVDAAAADMRRVRIGSAQVAVDEAYNRRIVRDGTVDMLWRNPGRTATRPVDTTLGIIHFAGLDGKPVATIVNYNAHPVITMDLDDAVVSADYPGQLSSHIARSLGGETLFLLGASGDVNPYDADTKPLAAALERSRAMGEKLGAAAVDRIGRIGNYRSDGAFRFETLRLKEPEAEIGVLLLTPDIALASFPGEYFDALGRSLKQRSPVPHTFFVGMANGDLRYVPTAEDARLGGFGADAQTMRAPAGTGEQHIEHALGALERLHRTQAAGAGE